MKTLAVLIAFASFSSFAATSANLNLKGKVNQILSISLAQQSISTTLPLDITQNDTLIGIVNEKSNSATGYKVTITSANAGNLKRNSGTQVFPYTMKYNGAALTLSAPIVQVNGVAAVDLLKDVTISYTGVPAAEMIAGVYTDTVTFSIAVN